MHCLRNKMTKPITHYIQPVVHRQLCIDIAFYDTNLGKTPKLLCIDTIEEFATIHHLPIRYQYEDVRNALLERLSADTLKDIKNSEIVADPEGTVSKSTYLLKDIKEYAHLKSSTAPTATHVALVENLAKKSKAKLIVTKSIYETAYGVKFPLYFVSTALENNVEKMNHISNQGTLSATAPAVLRGEEPLDYNSLISIKAGDIVLAYKREQDTNAVYVLVL